MATPGKRAKILYYDLETAPILGTVWRKWKDNLIWVEQDSYILCFAYKWDGERKTQVVSLPDFPGYEDDREDDRELVKELWRLLDEADIVVAHNGNRFDERVANARFVLHGLDPPSSYRTIDTLMVARRYFRFTSNSLNDLARVLGLGRKAQHAHHNYKIWRGCMLGDPSAWKKMTVYNAQDVRLLERVYKRLRPWIKGHPRVMLMNDTLICPKCAGRLVRNGHRYTKTMTYRRFRCKQCGGESYERLSDKLVPKPMVTD